ncbi:hypothetical protein [Prevotella histicola]|uniref:hypothetical protein n=1 Tax=Prevotella histicola TaxID=470565 RepID=UPI001C5DDB6D|nr:hypothetical protein [Prevotella histicola]MBW4757767.1 hypothetical protein [Prevotella histicola]
MKYTNRLKTYALCIGLALSVVSCSNDDFEGTNTTDDQLVDMTFVSAGLESPSNAEDITPSNQAKTRTVLGSDGTTVTWQANDKIGIGFKSPTAKNYPFTTPTAGSDVHFWGQAPNVNNVAYFMMYPYQQDAKISANNNTQAIYQYNFPKAQNAIAGTFDPKANVSVGIIPQRGKPFVAYNIGGLLRFSLRGTSNVKQVKLLSVGQENLAGNLKSTITFANDGKISAAKNEFSEASPVVNLTPASGSFEEGKAYYIALPEQKLSQGLTLVFIMQDGKAILKKVKQEVNIQRAKVYNLGEMALDPTKAKDFILKNQGLIEAVAAKVSGGLTTTADGHLNIYAADNLEKILSFKGVLPIANNNKLTSLDELQYYRNVTGLNLSGNQNLAGNLDLSKYKQLTEEIKITGSPNVSKVDITGLDVQNIEVFSMNGMKEVVMKDNNNLKSAKLYSNGKLENVDASNLPELTTLWTQGSGSLKTINTANTPNLKELNTSSDGNLTGITGLQDNVELTTFTAPYTKLTKLNFSNAPKLRNVNLVSSSVTEIKGLSAAGANLESLQLAFTHVASLDISNNPNLTSIDLYSVKELTALDVTHNPKLTSLRIPFTSISSLDVSNNTKLTYLGVAHCKLTTLDIRNIPGLTTFYAGSQSNSAGFSQMITITMTQAQKTKFGNIFYEDNSGPNATVEGSNNYVKVNVQ